jgi:Rieske Fe-S protein
MKTILSKLFLFSLILAFVLNESCKDTNKDSVPYITVDIVLDLQADLSHLGVGQSATITPNEQSFGVLRFSSSKFPEISLGQQVLGNGLILYRMGTTEFTVYDITCTYNATIDYCALEMDDTWLVPKCPCCGSEFNLLLEASPVSGPAALPLKQYSAFVRNNQLFIRN